MKKEIIILGVLLIGVGICVSTWLYLREQVPWTSQPLSSNGIGTVQPAKTDMVSDDGHTLTKKERKVERAKRELLSKLSEAQQADPFMQKVLEAIDSPEFIDLLEQDSTERQWNDFLESKGVPVTRAYPGLFRKVVSDIALEDYEPVVRLKLAQLFIAAAPVDLTDPVAAARQRGKVYLELGKELSQTDMAAAAWFIETFGEDRDAAFRSDAASDSLAFIWMTDIQQNAVSIVEAAQEVEDAHSDKTKASAPSWDMSSVGESPSPPHSGTEIPAPLDTKETRRLTNTAIEAEIERSLTPQPPDILAAPSPDKLGEIQSNLEASLKEQFSKGRFDRAMSTLEQHGQEEGLRRLRENDPEVAKQIDQHRKQEEVPK